MGFPRKHYNKATWYIHLVRQYTPWKVNKVSTMNVQRNVFVNVNGFKKVRNGLANEGEHSISQQFISIFHKGYLTLIFVTFI